jgi:hypothetical protein
MEKYLALTKPAFLKKNNALGRDAVVPWLVWRYTETHGPVLLRPSWLLAATALC